MPSPVLGGDGDTAVTMTAQPCAHEAHNPVGETDLSPDSNDLQWAGLGGGNPGTGRTQRGHRAQAGGVQGGLPGGGHFGTEARRIRGVRQERKEQYMQRL